MVCEKCGKRYDRTWKVCLHCNQQLTEEVPGRNVIQHDPDSALKSLSKRMIILQKLMWLMFVLSFFELLGASLQHVEFSTLFPSTFLILISAATLTFIEWRKKLVLNGSPILSLIGFILGLMSFGLSIYSAPDEQAFDDRARIFLVTSILSFIFCATFAIVAAKGKFRHMGNSLWLQGSMLNTSPLFISLVGLLNRVGVLPFRN